MRRPPLLLLLVPLAGCSQLSLLPAGGTGAAPASQAHVVQLLTQAPTERPFTELGPLTAAAGPRGDPYAALRTAAEQQGCDAVLLRSPPDDRTTAGACLLFLDGK
jgi:hypothetical protein